MKRIFNTILTIALVAMAMHTFDTFAVSRTQRKQQRQDLMRKRLVRQKGTPTGRGGTTARTRRALARGRRTPAIQKKSPEIRKQNAQMEQKIEQNTKVLEQAAAQKEKATTPAQKAVATKKVHEATQDLLNSISQKRTWEGDIYNGYEKKEIDEAKLLIEKLTKAKKTIEEKVKKKKEQLAKVTSKGWIFNTPLWNAPVEGKEAEYNKLTEEIYKLNNTLDRIDAALADQAVITGTSWSNAYKALTGAGALVASAITANIALYGSAGIVAQTAMGTKAAIGTGLSSAASWAQEKGGGTWESGKWVKDYGFKIAGNLFFLYNAYNQASKLYAIAKTGYDIAFAEEKKKNPNLTENQVPANLATLKADLDKKEAEAKAAKAKLDATLAQAKAQKGKK